VFRQQAGEGQSGSEPAQDLKALTDGQLEMLEQIWIARVP